MLRPSDCVFFFTACEASGDQIGASIIQALRQNNPAAQFVGVAGPLMRAAGCVALLAQEELAVMGFVAVLKQLPRLLKARRYITQQALAMRPAAYIGIDAPDFNLTIEAQLKAQGIKTVHVNSPTVWAWRSGRIKKIKRAIDLMLTLFPFERAIYQQHNIPVHFIGHPLANQLPRTHYQAKTLARTQLGFSAEQKILTLMPGSRMQELNQLVPIFLQAAKKCAEVIPSLIILAPMANAQCAQRFQQLMEQQSLGSLMIQLSIANAHQVLHASDVVLIKSGTGTLEAMLCKTPMVVAYKTDRLTFWLAKKLIKIPYVSLPNILANRLLVQEFLQEQATADLLAQACLTLLQNPQQQQQLIAIFDHLHQELEQDAAQSAAQAILRLTDL